MGWYCHEKGIIWKDWAEGIVDRQSVLKSQNVGEPAGLSRGHPPYARIPDDVLIPPAVTCCYIQASGGKGGLRWVLKSIGNCLTIHPVALQERVWSGERQVEPLWPVYRTFSLVNQWSRSCAATICLPLPLLSIDGLWFPEWFGM